MHSPIKIQIIYTQFQLNESLQCIARLETERGGIGGDSSGRRQTESDKTGQNSLLRQRNQENDALRQKLQILESSNEQLRELNGKLSQKLIKIKSNMDKLHRDSMKNISSTVPKSSTNVDAATATTELNELQKQRDYYQKEYMQLLNRPTYESDLEQLRSRLAAKEMDLVTLQQQHAEQSRELAHSQSSQRNNYSVQASVSRLQRERDVAQTDRDRLQRELDDLQRKLDATNEQQSSAYSIGDKQQREQQSRIVRLENENRGLIMAAGSHRETTDALRKELAEVRTQLRNCQMENGQLQTALNQLK